MGWVVVDIGDAGEGALGGSVEGSRGNGEGGEEGWEESCGRHLW